jgi:hypothetical protein
MVSSRSDVFSSASTTVSLDGVVQWGLNGIHVMLDRCRVRMLSSVVVASTVARNTKIMQISILENAWRLDGSDSFYSVYMRCSLRVY